jgi:hypothetical protein
MTARDFDASIRSACHFLNETGLLRGTMAFRSHAASSEFRQLALMAATSYRDLFLCGLRNSDYNFLLSDYAYFQFSYSGKDHYRMAYYPNPFVRVQSEVGDLDELLSEGVIGFEEYSNLLSDQPYEVTKPLIRFDLDCAAYVRLVHPAAHFHIGMHGENRWPVYRRLSPRSFTLLVVKLYYGTDWARGTMRREEDGFCNRFDRYFVAESGNCQVLGKGLIHEHERGQIHFT